MVDPLDKRESNGNKRNLILSKEADLCAAEKIKTAPNPALDSTDAIMARPSQHDATDNPVNLLKRGPPFIGTGHTQVHRVSALFYLQWMKPSELTDGNRVRVFTSQTSR